MLLGDKKPHPARPPELAGERVWSLAGRLAAILAAALVLFMALSAGITLFPRLFDLPDLPVWIGWLIAFGVTLGVTVWAASRFLRPVVQTVGDLSDGIRSFQDRDFSVRIATGRRLDELGELVELYNRVGDILQEERGQIRQRELLLQSALDQSPIAIVLVNPLERVLYANVEARQLLMGGERLLGLHFGEVLEACPPEMHHVLASEADGIFSVDGAEGPETYHLAQRHFTLNRQRHTLYLLRRMTAELARQEVEVWKKVIRIISHELNNSLAPISSLAHSARTIAAGAAEADRLEPIYGAIRERVEHLTGFLEGYARFARLPRPNREDVDWSAWVEGPRRLYDFTLVGQPPRNLGWFDPSQLEQVMINLLKNATEAAAEGADAPPIEVSVLRLPDQRFRVQVMDRGMGMPDDVMRQALLPFYTTKPSGTGVGLPLCREIIEAHGGSLRIQNREGGGTVVSFWLPARPA